jgi:hypothetical protein
MSAHRRSTDFILQHISQCIELVQKYLYEVNVAEVTTNDDWGRNESCADPLSWVLFSD